mmetsp:Transcript_4502/g.9682  ORF Transcript_4502/g.9682 Transcript_4502/m.9682 type:complete len:236 (+) Transcript_4502:660-1367(+)
MVRTESTAVSPSKRPPSSKHQAIHRRVSPLSVRAESHWRSMLNVAHAAQVADGEFGGAAVAPPLTECVMILRSTSSISGFCPGNGCARKRGVTSIDSSPSALAFAMISATTSNNLSFGTGFVCKTSFFSRFRSCRSSSASSVAKCECRSSDSFAFGPSAVGSLKCREISRVGPSSLSAMNGVPFGSFLRNAATASVSRPSAFSFSIAARTSLSVASVASLVLGMQLSMTARRFAS